MTAQEANKLATSWNQDYALMRVLERIAEEAKTGNFSVRYASPVFNDDRKATIDRLKQLGYEVTESQHVISPILIISWY
jgi:hypothetical protein